MHPEILTTNQKETLPLIHQFSKNYYLVGGTAIALQIGHRRSIDFDLFTQIDIKRIQIQNIIKKNGFDIQDVLYEAFDQIHCLVNNVKLTFFSYPFEIPANLQFQQIISMPSLLTLGAMKAYALGGRGKWKDYVDLYFLFRDHFSVEEIQNEAIKLYGSVFNEKLFREQLTYFEDIDYSEEVELVSENVTMEEIQALLSDIAVTRF